MRRRDLWAGHITAEDYERHMAATGQPQANADLLAELFRDSPPACNPLRLAGLAFHHNGLNWQPVDHRRQPVQPERLH